MQLVTQIHLLLSHWQENIGEFQINSSFLQKLTFHCYLMKTLAVMDSILNLELITLLEEDGLLKLNLVDLVITQ